MEDIAIVISYVAGAIGIALVLQYHLSVGRVIKELQRDLEKYRKDQHRYETEVKP